MPINFALSDRIYERDGGTIEANVKTGTGAQDVAGWAFTASFSAPDGSAVVKSSSDPSQIATIDHAAGEIYVYLLPADTTGRAGSWTWSLSGTDGSGIRHTLIPPEQFTVLSSG